MILLRHLENESVKEKRTHFTGAVLKGCEVTAASGDTGGRSRSILWDYSGLAAMVGALRVCAARHSARRPRQALEMWPVQLKNSIFDTDFNYVH